MFFYDQCFSYYNCSVHSQVFSSQIPQSKCFVRPGDQTFIHTNIQQVPILNQVTHIFNMSLIHKEKYIHKSTPCNYNGIFNQNLKNREESNHTSYSSTFVTVYRYTQIGLSI